VPLPRTDLRLSRLSFGTASLHHIANSRRRQDVLAAAFEHGFTHFDTAPSYGLGLAEIELGRFLKARSRRVTIATKVGLYAPPGPHGNTATVWARKAVGKLVPPISQSVIDWSIAAAKRSLDSSLRTLAVDQIDLLLLHEPLADAIDTDAFLHWLQAEQQAGRIRAWGLAGDARRMRPWLGRKDPLGMVLQVRDSLVGLEADLVMSHGRDLQISYGYLSSRSRGNATLTAAEKLKRALHRNTAGSILVSTRRVGRVEELAAVCEKVDGDHH
jgi:aryl-alcohol dehydrogenase-like predicted oxidoreductase